MGGGHIGSALRRLRGLLGADCAAGPTDGELLRRYVVASDEAAFEALLRRHGPMVLGVCRRLLTSDSDVDDAFQATFLILVRKARSIGNGERVGNWLYGVAYRVALRARAQAARRQDRQQVLVDVPGEDSPVEAVRAEIRAVLDEEVNRLPARYREAVVCCYLEGRTQEEAAHLLGWPKGTVATRLNRARELLRSRLTRRGMLLAGGVVAGLMSPAIAEAAVPAPLIAATLGATGPAAPGAVSVGAAALAAAVLRSLAVARVKMLTAGALAVTLLTAGGLATLTHTARVQTVDETTSALSDVTLAPTAPSMDTAAVSCRAGLPAAPAPNRTVRVMVIFVGEGTVLDERGLGQRPVSVTVSSLHPIPLTLAFSPDVGWQAATIGGVGYWSPAGSGCERALGTGCPARPLPLAPTTSS